MTDRRKNLVVLGILLTLCIICYGKILFTGKIIRAPDIINEYYWSVLELSKRPLTEIFNFKLHATWDIYGNTGNTLEGGGLGNQFLFWQGLLYYFLKPPASVGWFIVLHLFIGGAGTFMLCRAIGASLLASLLGGLVFSLAPEMGSLINAGHVLKIATISVAPWAFYLFEKGFQTRRVVWFMATSFVLALQFFYTHWQIAFYTCLGIGLYGIFRSIGILMNERKKGMAFRLFGLNLIVLCFFLSTVAIDLLPLANWSKETNRGALSGANQGKGGLNREEAMSWSMPPEELTSLVIPGFFGFSRQEAGENPSNIGSYYWGRMVFSQTTSYFGLLPWLLVPLPLIFRRDRYTWLAVGAIAGGLLFSMGKYTPFYNFLFDYFPGINRFRVPKMMLFIPLLGVATMAARGLDLLRDESCQKSRAFCRYKYGIFSLPLVLLALFGVQNFGKDFLINRFVEFLAQPTRYEQGAQLIVQRWNNMMTETVIMAVFAAGYAIAIATTSSRKLVRMSGFALVLIFIMDVARVNAKFMFLVDVPKESKKDFTTPVIDYLKRQPKEYRVLPLGSGPGAYSTNNVPIMFTPMPVQQQRWQDFIDTFNFASPMPDLINVRYLVYPYGQYAQERQHLDSKYVPVFQSPDGSEVVLENRTVLPKAWLVSSAVHIPQPQLVLGALQSQQFDPRMVALVESPPPLQMAPPDTATASTGVVELKKYEGERIELAASSQVNSLLVLGEKYYRGWNAKIDGKPANIERVNYILRGVYLPPGNHDVRFEFDPLPFKIGKWLTLASFALFAFVLILEWRRKEQDLKKTRV